MPQDLPNSQYILVAVAALNTQGRSWTWTSPIRSISDGEICHLLPCCLQTSWSLHHISISRIYRLLATCWHLSGVCALSSSRDIAQYHLNSPIYSAHKSTSVVCGKKHEIYRCYKISPKAASEKAQTTVSENTYTFANIDVFRTAIFSLLAPTGNNARASFLVDQLPRTSATVLWYRRMFTQFSLRVWVSEYTCRPMIANLLYYILPMLYMTLHDSTTFYHGPTWLYFTLLQSTMALRGST